MSRDISQSASPVDIHVDSHGQVGEVEAETDGGAADRGDAEGQLEQPEEDGQEVADAEDDEARRPRIVRRPLAPTKAMVEEHNRTHAEYRDWCPDCRAGKSTGLHHRRVDDPEGKLAATISVDYAFRIPEEKEEDIVPVLVVYDNKKNNIWTIEVPEKGVPEDDVAVDWLVDKLDASGYRGVSISLKSDNEPSILAFKNAVAIRRKTETSLLESPVRESKSYAHVERAVRTWRDQF